ncbi:MAG TPA: hypothetical protein VFO10_27300 [Oligoflexus sp.]|uniref:hypothetical protein n=1 Tax=Oligoflexus sp. TaxID=1971216 RepID=UPI002D7E76C0|nr:hypothetical protein [Oligoflexus sp.]HET9241003.1 hypothetical protein [Oligoflexus sp.]
MALKFGRMTLIPIGILASLPSCGEKTEKNEGFIPKLSEITKEDVLTDEQNAGSSLWAKVVDSLGITDIDRTSVASVTASLKVPSTKITDSTKATAWAAAKAGKVVADASSQKCSSIDAFVDLAPGTNYSISGNGAFKLAGTDGKTPTKLLDGTPLSAVPATAKVYLMKYKLQGDTASRNAIVTIPDLTGAQLLTAGGSTVQGALTVAPDSTSGHGYPVVFYAHAGATGLAYEEIAQTFGDMQSSHIIVAPVFPGEPFCVTYDTDATTGSKIPTCTGTNIGAAGVGTSDPYTNDVVDLMGAYECIKAKSAATDIPVLTAAGASAGTLPALSTKFAKISADVYAAAGTLSTQLGGTGTANGLKAAKVAGMATYPVSYAVGLGRGAAVANLAVARGGAINSVMFSTATDETTVAAQTALTTAGVTPGMFSCSIAAAPQSTFTAGLNKIILNYWVSGGSDFLNSSKQAALARIPGFANIKSKIDAIKGNGSTEDEQAAAIAAYIESIDTTYHMGLIHGGLANWGKVLRSNTKLFEAGYKQASDPTGAAAASTSATATLAAAQGSGLILHGTSDIVSSVSNSQLFSAIAVQTSTALEAASPRVVGGVNWLSLGIAPPAEYPVDGTLDVGHVSNASFLKGKAVDATTSTMTSDSSYTISNYVDKTPVEIITAWLASCEATVNAAAN